jgi:hypothetical protein
MKLKDRPLCRSFSFVGSTGTFPLEMTRLGVFCGHKMGGRIMKVGTLVLTAALLLPSIAAAMGCSGREHQAQSCATGTTWDANSQSCVKIVNS